MTATTYHSRRLTDAQHQAARGFAKYWTEGRRHNNAKAIADGPGRAGWLGNRIITVVHKVATLVNDGEQA